MDRDAQGGTMSQAANDRAHVLAALKATALMSVEHGLSREHVFGTVVRTGSSKRMGSRDD